MKTSVPSKKIKDLNGLDSLEGVRFIYPKDGQPYYWASQWDEGVWGKKDMDSGRVFPLFINNLSECLEWEVIEGK